MREVKYCHRGRLVDPQRPNSHRYLRQTLEETGARVALSPSPNSTDAVFAFLLHLCPHPHLLTTHLMDFHACLHFHLLEVQNCCASALKVLSEHREAFLCQVSFLNCSSSCQFLMTSTGIFILILLLKWQMHSAPFPDVL